jgi:hypothetical protein
VHILTTKVYPYVHDHYRKELQAEEKQHWENVAAKDKERYMNEKASYTGPWQVPTKRARKDPSAPKRPMSAFLYYAMGKRTELKKKHPTMINTNVSRLLGEMWRTASAEERKPFVEKEKMEREKYKVAMEKWKKEKEQKLVQELQRQEEAAASWQAYYNQNTATDDSETPFTTTENMYMPGPHGYAPYPYAAQPYVLPMNRKQPVILGPNGMPIMPYPTPPTGAPMALPQPPAILEHVYPAAATLPAPATYDTTENFEFPPPQEQIMSPETRTVE